MNTYIETEQTPDLIVDYYTDKGYRSIIVKGVNTAAEAIAAARLHDREFVQHFAVTPSAAQFN